MGTCLADVSNSAKMLLFFVFCYMTLCFHRFWLSGGSSKLSDPSPCSACIYPLDGFVCVFSSYPTVVFDETKAKLSVF